jgi:hypothetical protein
MREDYTLTDFFKDTAVIVDENMKLRRQIDELTKRLEAWKEYALECENYLDRHSYDTNLVAIDEQQKLRDLGEII